VQHNLPQLLTEADAGTLLGLAPATLRNMRTKGRGPAFIKVGGLVRYRHSDLVDWIESRVRHTTEGTRRSTAAYGGCDGHRS
jgi:predicted DNA-binding transcriptional regulator AlpA